MASFQAAKMESVEMISDTMEPRYSCPEVDVNFSGYDINTIDNIYNWQDCGTICSLNSKCMFWTLNNDKDQGTQHGQYRCYLKSSDANLEKSPGDISGVKGCL